MQRKENSVSLAWANASFDKIERILASLFIIYYCLWIPVSTHLSQAALLSNMETSKMTQRVYAMYI